MGRSAPTDFGGGVSVGHRAVWATRDDGLEGDVVAAFGFYVGREQLGGLEFRGGGLERLFEPVEGGVGDVDGALEEGELLGVLDYAELADDVRRGAPVRTVGRGELPRE